MVSKTILMIHGMWVANWCWEKYGVFFEEKGYHCKMPNLRYHDQSYNPSPDPRLGRISILDYVDDLEKEIREMDQLPIVMGHSMGGLLAQILAERGLAKALVLLTPAPPSGIFAAKLSMIRSFLNVLWTWGFWRKPIFPKMNQAVYASLHKMSRKEQKEIYEKMVFESGRSIFEIGLWPFDTNSASKVDETKIHCPILIIGAKEDRITPAAIIRKIANKYRNSVYREFPDQAHWVIGQPGWTQVADCIAEWLETLDA